MIKKTEGIVLRTFKYQDAHMIAVVYTQAFGIRRFMLKGFRSTRSRSKHSYFQPMSIVELVFFQKERAQLHKVSETRIAQLLYEIQSSPVKLSLGLTIVEIFHDCVKEEIGNEALYAFLRRCIVMIDQSQGQLVHVFMHFLVHLTRYLGFWPNDAIVDESKPYVFKTKEGVIENVGIERYSVAGLLRQFMYNTIEGSQQIRFSRKEKRELIQEMFVYYQFHVEGFKYPQTLRVFGEVFE